MTLNSAGTKIFISRIGNGTKAVYMCDVTTSSAAITNCNIAEAQTFPGNGISQSRIKLNSAGTKAWVRTSYTNNVPIKLCGVNNTDNKLQNCVDSGADNDEFIILETSRLVNRSASQGKITNVIFRFNRAKKECLEGSLPSKTRFSIRVSYNILIG